MATGFALPCCCFRARAEVAQAKPGSTAELRVWRDGKDTALKAQVDELEEKGPARVAARQNGGDETARLGIAVRPLTPQERKQVDTEGRLVVQEVSGPAAVAGVQPGDIILGVNGKPVTSVQQLRGAVNGQHTTVALLVERGNAQIFIPIRVG